MHTINDMPVLPVVMCVDCEYIYFPTFLFSLVGFSWCRYRQFTYVSTFFISHVSKYYAYDMVRLYTRPFSAKTFQYDLLSAAAAMENIKYSRITYTSTRILKTSSICFLMELTTKKMKETVHFQQHTK